MDQRIIDLIEDSCLNPDDKFNLLLVVDGVRPAASMEMNSTSWQKDTPTRLIEQRDIDALIEVITLAGLVYDIQRETVERKIGRPGAIRHKIMEVVMIQVARDEKLLKILVESIGLATDPYALGIALGYPKTAVEGFVANKKLSVQDMPIEYQIQPRVQFIWIVLSQDYWQDELLELEQWSERVYVLSRSIYWDAYRVKSCVDYDLAIKLKDRLVIHKI